MPFADLAHKLRVALAEGLNKMPYTVGESEHTVPWTNRLVVRDIVRLVSRSQLLFHP